MKMLSILLTMVLAAAAVCAGGCAASDAFAFGNRDNMRLLNWVEDDLMPAEGTTARLASYPVMVPLGLAATAADIIVVNPIYSIDDAVLDTQDACWDHFDCQEQYVTECAVLPFRVIGTPIVLVFDWGARCLFNISPNSRAPQPTPRNVPGDQEPPETVPEPPRRAYYVQRFFEGIFDDGQGVSVLALADSPRWIGHDRKGLGKKIVDALRNDSWELSGDRAVGGGGMPEDPLCWITVHTRHAVMSIWVDDRGFGISGGGRFANATLARILTELIDAGVFNPADAARWPAALRAAANAGRFEV